MKRNKDLEAIFNDINKIANNFENQLKANRKRLEKCNSDIEYYKKLFDLTAKSVNKKRGSL